MQNPGLPALNGTNLTTASNQGCAPALKMSLSMSRMKEAAPPAAAFYLRRNKLQHDNLQPPSLLVIAIATVVGTFATTSMTGRIAKINAAAVFIGLLFWGLAGGIPGLLLGIPIIVIGKVIAEHIDGPQRVAELLGEQGVMRQVSDFAPVQRH